MTDPDIPNNDDEKQTTACQHQSTYEIETFLHLYLKCRECDCVLVILP